MRTNGIIFSESLFRAQRCQKKSGSGASTRDLPVWASLSALGQQLGCRGDPGHSRPFHQGYPAELMEPQGPSDLMFSHIRG